jgi:hypothetical protein
MANSNSNGRGKPPPPEVHYRDAKTGEYVTKRYAEHHPSTTVKETDRKK